MYMNEHDIEDHVRQYQDHPILGPATRTLYNLMTWTNRNSDGWPYWQKPSRASAQLQDLIQGGRRSRYDNEREDVTEAAYKKALVPVKAFRTRMVADFYIEEVGKGPESARITMNRYSVTVIVDAKDDDEALHTARAIERVAGVASVDVDSISEL